MTPNEVIFKAGGEGGSIALYGLRTEPDWLFSFDFIDPAAAFASHATEDGKVVTAWQGALELLADRPWHMLKPLLTHPEFRVEMLNALLAREKLIGGGGKSGRWQLWKNMCAPSQPGAAPEDLARYQTEADVHSSDGWLYGLVDD